jgi:uncharacterized protein
MSMLLDLSRFRGGVDRLERRFDPVSVGHPEDDFRVVAPVTLSAEVRKDAEKVRLVGRVAGTIELECGRCLEPFSVSVDAAFDLMFLPAGAHTPTSEDRELGEADTGVSFYHEDVIDLGEVIREQFYLALPMKPLCRDDCAGLCPVCGINKNREACSCESTWVDPRMEPLRRLKSE